MSTTLWIDDKTVAMTGERRHRHKGKPIAPGFSQPALAGTITFGPTALAAAIARTATLRTADPELLSHYRDSALSETRILVADGNEFALTEHLTSLVDSERSTFAGRVGAGITDLYMNALGYVWRDNAACLASSLKPHADFLYYGGPSSAHGVVLAEARGSFEAKASDSKMAYEAQRKYLRQVRPYIGAMSPHGQVIHGYAVAFGSRPTTTGAFLRISQTQRPKVKASGNTCTPDDGSDNGVPAGVALASHRSNFILLDALPIADWIDWLNGLRDLPDDRDPIAFIRFEYAGRRFLACADALLPYHHPRFWFDDLFGLPFWRQRHLRLHSSDVSPLPCFVMEEDAATAFLNTLTRMIAAGSREASGLLELPRTEVAGFSLDGADRRSRIAREDYDYALFGDGLALIAGKPPQRSAGVRIWHPKEGLH
ncbi:hypothetical protein [uncultured Brevundimonas sp.]|uniref:hypothetical protein n=1 Tax=uncultured Brevundimonas sp. TaxID=213418 RepID=UPI002633A26A|nr:hypothetical protein [uncultured Brevundimonas sp.]